MFVANFEVLAFHIRVEIIGLTLLRVLDDLVHAININGRQSKLKCLVRATLLMFNATIFMS